MLHKLSNRPLLSFLVSLFQNESAYETTHMNGFARFKTEAQGNSGMACYSVILIGSYL